MENIDLSIWNNFNEINIESLDVNDFIFILLEDNQVVNIKDFDSKKMTAIGWKEL